VRGYDLITLAELEEIRRIWVVEKHEIEDALPTIYKEATGRPYPGSEIDEDRPFTATEMELLREVCGEDRILYELARELIDIEHSFRAKSRRLGIYNDLKDAIKRGFYKTELDAVTYAQSRAEQKDEQRRRTQSVADAEAVSDYIRQLELSIGDNQG
jgi:DNA sulfur modification protein DndC